MYFVDANAKTFSGKPFTEVDFLRNFNGKRLFCKYWKHKQEHPRFVFHFFPDLFLFSIADFNNLKKLMLYTRGSMQIIMIIIAPTTFSQPAVERNLVVHVFITYS